MKINIFMEKICILGILALILCFSTNAAEWQFVSDVKAREGDGSSGWINQIAIHPTKPGVFYAATENAGVLLSKDGGKNWVSRWQAKRMGLTADSAEFVSGYRVKCIEIDPVKKDVIYAGMDKQGIYKSSDAGVNWTEINEMLMDTYIGAISIHPARPDFIYLGTYGGGMYRRSAEASDWEEIVQGMRNTYVTDLVISTKNPDIMYVSTNGGISKTTDGGSNWITVNNGLTTGYMLCLAISPDSPDILYAGSDGRGLFKTTDGGENWFSVGGEIWMTETLPGNMALVASVVAVNPVNTEIVYAANSSGVFRSADAGKSWTQINTGLTNTDIKSLTVTSKKPVRVYAGTADGQIFAWTEE